jgi:6-phosphogluconolactonase
MKIQTERFQDVHEWARAAAGFICDRAEEAAAHRGVFTLVLSGGTSPRPVYEALAAEPFAHRMPWERMYAFFSDERLVPEGHPDSNLGMARKVLLSRVPLPEENLYPISAAYEDAEAAAEAYERELRGFSGESVAFPRFDLVLLGLGQDGHTASLFPGDAALAEKERWVAAVPKPGLPPPHPRVTMTLVALNHADHVLFLAAGAEKRALADRILQGSDPAARTLPAAQIAPRKSLTWLLAP